MLQGLKHVDYITSYYSPKTVSLRQLCCKAYHNVMSAHVKVHGDVPRNAFDIPKMSDAHYWNDEKPNSLWLFVRWLNHDDSGNSWIQWSDNQDLAALDSYLVNNPDLKVTDIFKYYESDPE